MKINLSTSPSDRNVIRSIYVAVIVLAPIFHWILIGSEPDAIDSLTERFVAMGVAGFFLALSFWRPYQDSKWLQITFYLCIVALQLWVTSQAFRNEFSLLFTTCLYFTTTVMFCLFYKNPVLVFPFIVIFSSAIALLPGFGSPDFPVGWSM
ncbi:MAG: hypothetical protein AAFV80_23850, partial [Bacteroidota bacterium]